MFVVTNRIPVASGHEADFEDRFRNRAHLIDQSPGFIKNLVLSVCAGLVIRPGNGKRQRSKDTIWCKPTGKASKTFGTGRKSESFRIAHITALQRKCLLVLMCSKHTRSFCPQKNSEECYA